MVKIFLITFLFIISGCSSEYHFIEDNNEPTQFLKLNSVQIVHKGAYSGDIASDETPDACKEFILSAPQIIDFFTTANSINLREYEHELIASNCYMDGTFVSADGTSGTWKIDRSRRGFLYTVDGNATYYYCNECDNPLFYQSCDINCIHNQ